MLQKTKILKTQFENLQEITIYYINTNEIPSGENLISSRVKICCHGFIINRALSHQKTIKVKWFGSSLVFI